MRCLIDFDNLRADRAISLTGAHQSNVCGAGSTRPAFFKGHMAKATAHPLAKTVKKVADAKPATPNALLTLVRIAILPVSTTIFGELLEKDKTGKSKHYAIELRDWLIAADLGDK